MKKPGRPVIPALHTGEDLRLRDLGEHKVMWMLTASSTCSNLFRPQDLGYEGFIAFGLYLAITLIDKMKLL